MKQLLITIAAVVLVGCGPPKALDISIHQAVAEGDIEAVKRHLNAGTDVNEKEKNATINWRKGTSEIVFTPLHYAAKNYHMEIAELLIANGAGINEMCGQGFTPLDYLEVDNKSWGLKEEMIKLLRKHGGKLKAFNDAGN